MSSKANPRRGHDRIHDNGPRWEHGGSDNSAVARARKKWKRRMNRKERRTGEVEPFVGMFLPRHRPDIEER